MGGQGTRTADPASADGDRTPHSGGPGPSSTGRQADTRRDLGRTTVEPQGARRGACRLCGNDYNRRMSTPNPIPFDTLRFVKRMTGAGMPLAQAEALAEEQRVLMDAHFATRRDTDEVKLGLAEVKRDTEELKLELAEVKRDIEKVKLELAEVKRDIEEVKRDIEEVKRDIEEVKLELAEVKRDIEEVKLELAEVKRDIEELKLGLAEVKRDIEEVKLGLAEVKRDIEELKLGLAVQKAELTMVKWIVSGVGFGMLLLLVRTFWPV